MKIDIPMKRVKVDDILSTYNRSFLEDHNCVICPMNFDDRFTAIVKTKYGYLAVNYRDYITYVGNGIWSVTKDDSTD